LQKKAMLSARRAWARLRSYATARRSPPIPPHLVPASPQRPAIRWDLTPRSAPNRSLIRFSSFNETCDRRLDGSVSLPHVQQGASPCPVRVKGGHGITLLDPPHFCLLYTR